MQEIFNKHSVEGIVLIKFFREENGQWIYFNVLDNVK